MHGDRWELYSPQITRELTGVTEANPVDTAVDGESYQNIFSVAGKDDATLEVTVTMDGADVTGKCLAMAEDKLSAQIKMDAVNGDIVITAAAAAKAQVAEFKMEPLTASLTLERKNGSFRV